MASVKQLGADTPIELRHKSVPAPPPAPPRARVIIRLDEALEFRSRQIEAARVKARIDEERLALAQWNAAVSSAQIHCIISLKPLPRLPELSYTPGTIDPLPDHTPARQLIGRVAAWHKVTLEQVLSRSRAHPFKSARFDAIAAVRSSRPGRIMNTSELGRIFNRDHTSIQNALYKLGLVARPYSRRLKP